MSAMPLVLALHGESLARGILMALVLLGLGTLIALGVLVATVWAIAKRKYALCRRLAMVDFALAAAASVSFALSMPSADAPKLLVPAVVFSALGFVAWRRSRA